MIQKYLILIDEQSQSAGLERIKSTLRNEGIDLVYKEYNPQNFQKRENRNVFFDKDSFTQELGSLRYFKQLDSIVCDYNLIKDVVNGFEIIKIVKGINPAYKKQIILYSANIDDVIGNIINIGDFEVKRNNIRELIKCNIDFIKREGYESTVISHIKKEKPFSFEEELIKWFYSRKDDEFNGLFPKYQGKKFEEIAKCLETDSQDSIEFRKELIEQIIAYLSTINGLPDAV